jgi:NAD(P)-dependent dehydrogenase (short-subunit alcohol dehydrogenase family)
LTGLALVTGASRGIGAATAEALAARARMSSSPRARRPDLEEVEERIHEAGGNATIAPLDLTEQDSIAKLAAAVAERWGKLDMLVLNAAMLGTLTPVAQIDGKEFNKLLTLNLLAQQALIAAFDPLLRKSEAGRLVAITSSVGRHPRAYWGAYGASKAALETLVLAYAEEVAQPRAAQGRDRRSRAPPQPRCAPAPFPGEDPGDAQAAERGGGGDRGSAEAGFRDGERLEVTVPSQAPWCRV